MGDGSDAWSDPLEGEAAARRSGWVVSRSSSTYANSVATASGIYD